MANMSDYLEVELRKHIFRTGSFTKPTVLAVGLFTVTPSDSGGGTEVSGGSYARVQRDMAPGQNVRSRILQNDFGDRRALYVSIRQQPPPLQRRYLHRGAARHAHYQRSVSSIS